MKIRQNEIKELTQRFVFFAIGLGYDLTRIALDPNHPRRLASEAEVLALRPELLQIE